MGVQSAVKAARAMAVAEAQLDVLLALTQACHSSQAASSLPPERSLALLSGFQVMPASFRWQAHTNRCAHGRSAHATSGAAAMASCLIASENVQSAGHKYWHYWQLLAEISCMIIFE